MDVICPECDREFYIGTGVWEDIVSDVSNHIRGECPNCGEGMCFTCQFVSADIFAAQGVRPSIIAQSPRSRERRPSRPPRRPTIRKPNYPF